MNNPKYQLRILNKIRDTIKKLDLNLSECTVLTEVGSNLYSVTPLIPLLAGAHKVYAWTRDTKYGLAKDNIAACKNFIKVADIEHKVEFFEGNICEDHLRKADIITNSGFLRPLDEEKLKHVRSEAVIPLMYEAWELRNSDIDIDYCRKNKIRVAGTWENYPKIKVFDHIGPLAIKMAFEAGFEVFNNHILIWSDDHFGDVIKDSFEAVGVKHVTITTDQDVLYQEIRNLDFIFLADYDETREFGSVDFLDFSKISKLNVDIGVIHLFGRLNVLKAKNHIDIVYPIFDGQSDVMSFTLAHLGLNPFINLQVAGFKVAEMLKSNTSSPLLQKIT